MLAPALKSASTDDARRAASAGDVSSSRPSAVRSKSVERLSEWPAAANPRAHVGFVADLPRHAALGQEQPFHLVAAEGARAQASEDGHLHRPLAARFRGIPLAVTPSVAPLVALDLTPIDCEVADDRDLITTEPPTYALHRWDGAELITHYETVSDWQVLASFGEHLKPMIREMFAERG